MSHRLLVLCYHNVRGTWCFPSGGTAGPRGLERQLWALRRFATVVPAEAALQRLVEGRPLPRSAVALTFDDGYADNLELVAPLLERLGLPATFFLIPGLLSRSLFAWWETLGWAFARTSRASLEWEGVRHPLGSVRERALAHELVAAALKRRDRQARERDVAELVALLAPVGEPPGPELFLGWSGARALVARGHAVGSHSSFHAILAQEAEQAQRSDLLESRRDLEAGLDVPVPLLAYPNGTSADYDAGTLRAAAAAGHTFAMTTTEGFNRPDTPRLEIRRAFMLPERGVTDLLVNLRYLARDLPPRGRPQ